MGDPRVGLIFGRQDAAPTTRSRRPWSDSVGSHWAVSGVGSAAQPTTGFLVRAPWVGRKMGKKVPKMVHQPKTVLEGPSLHPFGPRGANGGGWVGSGIPRPAPPCLPGIWSARVEREGQEERKEPVVKQGDSSHAGAAGQLAAVTWPAGVSIWGWKGRNRPTAKFSPNRRNMPSQSYPSHGWRTVAVSSGHDSPHGIFPWLFPVAVRGRQQLDKAGTLLLPLLGPAPLLEEVKPA